MFVKVYVLFSFTSLIVIASDITNLRKKFNERVDAVINKTIHSDDCGMYANLIKLEYTDTFCEDDFLKYVSI